MIKYECNFVGREKGEVQSEHSCRENVICKHRISPSEIRRALECKYTGIKLLESEEVDYTE